LGAEVEGWARYLLSEWAVGSERLAFAWDDDWEELTAPIEREKGPQLRRFVGSWDQEVVLTVRRLSSGAKPLAERASGFSYIFTNCNFLG